MRYINFLMPAVLGVSALITIATYKGEPQPASPVAAPAAATPAVQIDQAALMKDVQTLSSEAFAGRRTGTEGSKLAQAYLAERFRQIGLAPFGASYAIPFSFTHQEGKEPPADYSAVNLLGHIKGSKYPDRVIVVSAHYDHLGTHQGVIYSGADDNASGVGAMLAVASHFRQHPPQNTIVFAAFDGEELDMGGATAMVSKPPVPIEQIKFNLNLDMVSRSDRNEIFASGTSYTPSLKPLVEQVAAGSTLKVRFGHDRPADQANGEEDWTNSSDHGAFHKAGIPFLYLGVEDHADYHKGSDTADKIKPGVYTETTRLIVRMAQKLDQNLEQVR